MTDKKCEHDIGFTSWHKGNCLAGKTAFPRCPYCPKPKGDEMKSPSEIAEEIVSEERIHGIRNGDAHERKMRKEIVDAIESERKRAEGLEQRELQSIKYLNRLATWAQQDPTGPWEKYKIQEWVLNQIKGALGQKIEETDWQPKALSSHEGREEGKEGV